MTGSGMSVIPARSSPRLQRQVFHPVKCWMAATLDGMVEATGAVLFMLPWSFSEEGAADAPDPTFRTVPSGTYKGSPTQLVAPAASDEISFAQRQKRAGSSGGEAAARPAASSIRGEQPSSFAAANSRPTPPPVGTAPRARAKAK